MATQIQSLEAWEDRLQKEAAEFLVNTKLELNGLVIQPTEIEVYYHHVGEFADTSVHQNVLQQNNAHHFYIHRYGVKKSDPIKGNRAGIDFVLSNESGKYYTYLIRSAVINNQLIVGPHKVLVAIQKESHLEFNEIENLVVQTVKNKVIGEVLFSERINLGKNAGDFRNLELRAVLCDDRWFKESSYRNKPQMIIEYIKNQKMSKEKAFEYANQKLGYIPNKLREIFY